MKPKTKKFTPPFKMTGNLLSQNNVSKLQELHDKKMTETPKKKNQNKKQCSSSPKPSTSGLNKTPGAPLNLVSSDSSSDEEFEDNDEKCCVCSKRFPPQLRGCPNLVFVKWGQCDECGHWVHLIYCCTTRVLRRDSTFRCIHCPEE